MLKRKRIRERGKVSLMKIFQKFDSGDSVALVMNLSEQSPAFPKRMQGRTGRIVEKRGSAYVVKVKDYNKEKTYVVLPVHLKKVMEIK